MSSIRLCKGIRCLAENDFGLPRDKGSFRPGSKVCDRCEDAADRAAGVRPVRMPVAAPAAPPPAVETKAPALDRVPCKRCGVPFHPEELNKDGGCKPCKKKSNAAQHQRKLALRGKAAESAGAPAAAGEVPAVTPPPPPPMQRVDAGPAVDAGPIVDSEPAAAPAPADWMSEMEQLLSELQEVKARHEKAENYNRQCEEKHRWLARKITTLEHALTASRVMYESLEDRFHRHVPEALQR